MDKAIKLKDRKWFQDLPQDDLYVKYLLEADEIPDTDPDKNYIEIYQAIVDLAMRHFLNFDMCNAIADHFGCEHSDWAKYGTDEGSWIPEERDLY